MLLLLDHPRPQRQLLVISEQQIKKTIQVHHNRWWRVVKYGSLYSLFNKFSMSLWARVNILDICYSMISLAYGTLRHFFKNTFLFLKDWFEFSFFSRTNGTFFAGGEREGGGVDSFLSQTFWMSEYLYFVAKNNAYEWKNLELLNEVVGLVFQMFQNFGY